MRLHSERLTNGRGLWITADCRIDNREELESVFRSCGLWLGDRSSLSDPACILLAYERWGEEAPLRLLGDFAFAVWDERRRTLFCARDPIGVKPFHYHWDGRKFLFGSEIKQIYRQDPSVSEALDVGHLADHLTMSFPNREDTPFQAVKRLPGGHSLTVRENRLSITHYFRWNPDKEPPSRASLEENAQTLRGILEEAVRARLRTSPNRRTGSLLSGGLDSGSITALAAKELPGLPVFTLYFPEADPAHRRKNTDDVDEGPYIRSLLERYPLEPHRIEIRGWGPLRDFEEYLRQQETLPLLPNLAYFRHLFRRAGAANIGVLLNGEGGDEAFKIGPWCLGNRLQLSSSSPSSLANFFLAAAGALLPEWAKTPYRWLRPRWTVPPWIRPEFARRIGLVGRMKSDPLSDPALRRSASFGMWYWLRGGMTALYLEAFYRAALPASLEVRYPFLDLRVLRFCASLPWRQKHCGRVKKKILREALGESLPPPIRHRMGKSEFTPVVRMSLERYAGQAVREMLRRPHPLLESMIRTDRFRPSEDPRYFWDLWHLIGIDSWLKMQPHFKLKEELVHEKTPKVLV